MGAAGEVTVDGDSRSARTGPQTSAHLGHTHSCWSQIVHVGAGVPGRVCMLGVGTWSGLIWPHEPFQNLIPSAGQKKKLLRASGKDVCPCWV